MANADNPRGADVHPEITSVSGILRCTSRTHAAEHIAHTSKGAKVLDERIGFVCLIERIIV